MRILWILPCLFWLSFAGGLHYTGNNMSQTSENERKELPTAYAKRFHGKLDKGSFPDQATWEKTPAIRYEDDWQGKNPDVQRATEVRLLWTPGTLFIRFYCKYRTITVFPDSREDGFRLGMWDRDVAETFLQPDSTDPMVYTEFEVSPNNKWIDLAVSHGKIKELHSGLWRRVEMDDKAQTWTAELAIPMAGLTKHFDVNKPWRANFYRIEGEEEPRFYSAWSPTYTPKPSFHVPARFGTLIFQE